MKTMTLQQGSTEWLAYRNNRKNASDAPVMLGCSPHHNRTELLNWMHTGIRPEATSAEQRRFDRGHEIEAQLRPVAEAIIGQEIFPCVGSETVAGVDLSASFDGLDMLEQTNWECKTLNEDLRGALPNPGPDGNDAANLPKCYRVQMEQQCAVSGCQRVLFTAATLEGEARHCWYYPDLKLRAEIIAGWKQFDVDLAAYVPQAPAVEVVAEPVMALPALTIQVQGSITLVDNLKAFGAKLREFVEGIDRAPTDDQGFVNCESAVKTLKTAEDALKAAEANALAQTASVDEMRRTVAAYADLARSTRLTLEKMVKARKEEIRAQIVQAGRLAFAEHLTGLNTRLGGTFMPKLEADFAGAVKSKRTLSSLRDAVDTELARAKIQANEIADQIQVNLNAYNDVKATHGFLFADLAALVHKAPEDFAAALKLRIAEHDEKVRRQQEAERERIRQEEAAKLKAEAEAHKTVAEGAPIPSPSVADLKLSGNTVVVPLKQTAAKATRPTDDEIIAALATYYRVHEMTVIGWLLDVDLNAASERAAKEFA